MRLMALLLLCTLILAGCESKAKKVQQLQAQYNAEYPAYAKDCVDVETAGSARLLTGQEADPTKRWQLSQPRRRSETPGASRKPTILRTFNGRSSPRSSKPKLLV